tara:strand:- start:444 stop:1139 length:696 start_codon:yes stop_codon:yes gene_type:complete
MSNDKEFDFWYAVNNTKLITTPTSKLETFGDTIVNYSLICEDMDNVNKICIKEGQIKALKPTIITPDILGKINLNDFGSDANEYAEWLKNNAKELNIMQYGFSIYKQEIKEYFVTDNIDNVVERVKKEKEKENDPLSAIIIGVNSPWEVCLLKLVVDLVQKSAQGNFNQLKKHSSKNNSNIYDKIDNEFVFASKDPSRINNLAKLIKQNGLWKQYEDRFFALVKSSQNNGG